LAIFSYIAVSQKRCN